IAITSDHGEAFGEYGFWEHRSCYRNISHLPLILNGSSIPKKNLTAYTQNIDVMPTLLDLAGLDIPEGLSGKSMLPLLKGRQEEFRDKVLVSSDHGAIQRMFVENDYALVHTLERGAWDHVEEYELFDLSKDPHQVNDISTGEEPRASEMRLKLRDWLAETLGDHPDPLELSHLRGSRMWTDYAPKHLDQEEFNNLLENYPEIKRSYETDFIYEKDD
ncbi:hypothetical protein AKJ65_04290, partial [candidate division MSBL1 archaeon SCGC-AAA259E19]